MDVLVSIICTVYNHAPYLRQCLDGFVMQKTDFPFEIIVHDDASTDGSSEIIVEYADNYPELFVTILQKENKYSKGIPIGSTYMYPKARGKYIAECEGDDFWIDPLKLQKQVDILERNSSIGCVYSSYEVVDKDSNIVEHPFSVYHLSRSFSGDIFLQLLYDNFPQTLTVVFRRDLLNSIVSFPYQMDYSLFLLLALQKDFLFINEKTGAYRLTPGSIMQSKDICRFDFNPLRLAVLDTYFSHPEFRRKGHMHLLLLKYYLFHQCRITFLWRYRYYHKSILSHSKLLILAMPIGVFASLLVTIKQKFEE